MKLNIVHVYKYKVLVYFVCVMHHSIYVHNVYIFWYCRPNPLYLNKIIIYKTMIDCLGVK